MINDVAVKTATSRQPVYSISWMGKPIEMLDGNKGNTIKTFDGANNKVKEGGGGGGILIILL